MERKRKLPARAARVETVSKKRTSTPPEPRSQPTPPPPPPVIEQTLPKSVVAGKPLPTVDEPQGENLSAKDFQTISESGVLAESIQRSKAKWLSEGIFERYWTKPTAKSKKNAGTEIPNNPPKDSMTKLGPCTITVEPHVFEAQMFAIKESHPKPAMVQMPPQPMYRPIIQYGPPNGVMPLPPPPPPPPPPPVQKAPTPKPEDNMMRDVDKAIASQTNPGSQPSHGVGMNSQGPTNQHTNPPPPTNPPASAPTKTTDPVIQMLAERAATDPGLKALMRIVADGEARPEELKRFQTHIDELTRLQRIRQAASQPPPPPPPPPEFQPPRSQNRLLAERAATDPELKALMKRVADGIASPEEVKRFRAQLEDMEREEIRKATSLPPPLPAPPAQNQSSHFPPPSNQVNGHNATRPPPSPAPVPAPAPIAVARPPPPPAPKPQYQPQPQALRSKGPLPPTKPDISGIVFEFAGGSGDRFLFPKFSILEYLPQGQVIASFLIVRKGSSSDSPTYDPELDYYQPITIRLYAHQGRQLEALQKVVAPQDEVRRYMDDIMDNMTRAEYVLLAMRLPKDKEQSPAPAPVEEVERPIQIENQVLWTTTNPIPAPAPVPQMRPVPRLLTEEEKYQNFIGSVSQKV